MKISETLKQSIIEKCEKMNEIIIFLRQDLIQNVFIKEKDLFDFYEYVLDYHNKQFKNLMIEVKNENKD